MEEKKQQFDIVENPSHYCDGSIQCIEVMAFCELNAFKYLWRSEKKKNKTEDLKKSKRYIEFYLNEYPYLYLKVPLNYLITIIGMYGSEKEINSCISVIYN